MTLTKQERIDWQTKLKRKEIELQEATSQLGPIILAVIGFLTMIFLIGFIFIALGAVWSYMRSQDVKRLTKEIAEIEEMLSEGKN